MTDYPFLKGHGTENDFVLLPDLDGGVHGDLSDEQMVERVRALCDRRAGIGGDGVLRVVRDDDQWFMDYRNADGYKNILVNPHVGLTFLIPGRGDTLRINGRARLVSDAPFFDDLVVKGHRPLLAVVVEIDDIFFHCAKAFLRSGLWKPETWDPNGTVPRRAVIAKDVEPSGMSLDELDAYYAEDNYAKGLYGASHA